MSGCIDEIFRDRCVLINFCLINIKTSSPGYKHLTRVLKEEMRALSSVYLNTGLLTKVQKEKKMK